MMPLAESFVHADGHWGQLLVVVGVLIWTGVAKLIKAFREQSGDDAEEQLRRTAEAIQRGQLPQVQRRPTSGQRKPGLPVRSLPPRLPAAIRRASPAQIPPAIKQKVKAAKTAVAQIVPVKATAKLLQPLAPAVDFSPISNPGQVRPSIAAALHNWLTPETLRQQFILTEVLNPPIALRESHLG